MKARHLLMSAGLAIATWLVIFGDGAPVTEISEPIIRAPGSNTTATPVPLVSAVSAGREPLILALLPRDALLGGAQGERTSHGLFGSQTWAPPPPPPPETPPAPAPSAPPMPYTYLGKKLENGAWEVYLARRDQTFIVNAQTVIEGTYRVEAIKPPVLSLTYLPLNQVQTLPIGGTD